MRIISPNQQKIIAYLHEHGTATFTDFEKVLSYNITKEQDFKHLTYIIAETFRDGIITMKESKDASFIYSLSAYGKSKVNQII